MKKSIFALITAALCASTSLSLHANTKTCQSLALQAEQDAMMFHPHHFFEVKGQKGFRSHFYTAPAEQCKQRNLFLVPKDAVIAYESVDRAGQSWMSVMYVRKDGSTVTGWMKEKDFKLTGKINQH